MAFLGSMNIVGSGLTAQQLRLDVISENITNLNTTRTEEGDGPYRRKIVVFEAESGRNDFRMAMASAMGASNRGSERAGGVKVVEIAEDPSPFSISYDPTHPDADEEGYLEMPNITLVKEITDAMAATQAYSANVTAFNTLKAVVARGMDIGR
ncbi:flagellar basal body rod protein FlgC [Neglecta sp. X4]|uniref:flagellar basal body rod protein FlgC n=1 Tax=unclassified Neglectibacter TaxID=2632164 RepID=UPI00136E796B|nr:MULTISPECIES: flagellar basal body rod protein FlgC [unclassified Neglectibacter]NBI17397.1 flagellar basal body rod protein FlgC [Neglectibacter sp. 59]NBJ73942.1 flagellar basal body rod protein FlgC [Neglectibacter sp. X4]NCE80517.1 flagellar basal body rod protein FlgC [Neglectibacter sp. X58]